MAAEVLQELDLTQRPLGEDLLAEDICDLLDGDPLVGLVIHGCTAVVRGLVSEVLVGVGQCERIAVVHSVSQKPTKRCRRHPGQVP